MDETAPLTPKPKRKMSLIKRGLLGVVALIAGVFLVITLSIPISIYETPNDLLEVDIPSTLTVDNVHLVDVRTGEIQRDRQLRIVDGRITEINATGSVHAEGTDAIDAGGAFVTPGLFDMHVHIHDRKYFGLYLAHGVTTVRNMRGLPMHLRWKRELQNREWLGSNLYTSSPVLDGEKYAHALQQVVTSPDEARRLVRLYQDAGYDVIKAYGFLDAPVFEAIVEEANAIGIPVTKHGPNAIQGLPLSSNRGLQSLEHVEDILQGALDFNFEPDALDEFLVELKSLNPVVTPTLTTYDHLTQLSEFKESFVDELPMQTLNPLYRTINREFVVNRWLASDDGQVEWNKKCRDHLLQIVKAMDDKEVKLVVGSDAGTLYLPPGVSTHREIELMVQAGMSPESVLKAGTINAAETLGIDDQYGTIEVGKVADLIIVESNPLENLALLKNPKSVIKSGQWLSETELQKLRTSGQNPSSFYVSCGRLLQDVLSRKFQ
jgi:hypothetical protein